MEGKEGVITRITKMKVWVTLDEGGDPILKDKNNVQLI